MTQGTYTHDRPYVNVSTIGHVDHGKTTLTAAITKVLAEKYPDLPANKLTPFGQVDNVSEERQRGITINVSYVEYETPSRHCAYVDAPGHTGCIKNVITDTVQMDGAIPVIAATDGLMTQTKEHILLAEQVGVPSILVALSKCDSPGVDEDMLKIVEDETRDDLEKQGFDRDRPIVHVSALKALEGDPEWAKKIEELMDVVDTYIPTPERDLDKPFLMPIEDVFTITGRGTVATGRVERGKLPSNSEVEIVGIHDIQEITVTGIEMFHESTDEACAGENCGLLLRGTKREDVERGQVVCVLGSVTPYTKFEGKVYISEKEEGGRHKSFYDDYRPQFLFRTADVTGVIKLPKGTEMVMPGDTTEISAELIQPIAMGEGLGLAIREGGRTVGSGKVTKIIE